MSYLCNRTQRVKFKSLLSSPINVHSGVPQGSHLGPMLFIMYINDLPDYLDYANVLLYADDVKLFYKIDSTNDCEKLQHDFNNLSEWSNANFLQLNLKKCKTMSFNRLKTEVHYTYNLSGASLEKCILFNDLGVIFDPKMTFNHHIDVLASKAQGRLGLIKRWAKEFDDPYVTLSLYVGLVRSLLEFACQVWNPFYNVHINRLESIQKQFLIFALRGLNWENRVVLPPYRNRLQLLNLMTLEDRRKMLSCCFVWNIVQGNINCKNLLANLLFNCPIRVSRFFVPLKLRLYNCNYLNFAPYFQCLKFYNLFYFLFDNSSSIRIVKKNISNYCKMNRLQLH